MTDETIDLGRESKEEESFVVKKDDVNPYDIFRLAKGILIVAAIIYMTLALIRIFYNGSNDEGIKEVWEYSKVFLNSLVSLVLGLYFGSKYEAKKPG